MKRTKILGIGFLVLCAVLLGWFCLERVHIWRTHKGLERAMVHHSAAEDAYNAWLAGEDVSLRPIHLYTNSLESLARWNGEDSVRLRAYYELQLAYGRLALIAQKNGDSKGYTASMQRALDASRSSGKILFAYDGVGGPFRIEAEIVGLVEYVDATAAWWKTWLGQDAQADSAAVNSGAVAPQAGASVLERLQGTWISDREGTVAALRADEQWQDRLEMIEKLEPLFGKLIITYNEDVALTQRDGERGGATVAIKNEAGNRARVSGLGEDDVNPLEFRGSLDYGIEVHDDHYWCVVPGPRGYRERFVRMKETDEGQGGASGSGAATAEDAEALSPLPAEN